MARHLLTLNDYSAETVLFPQAEKAKVPGKEKLVEAFRVTVFGDYFPQRAVEPELLIGENAAHQVAISRDQRSIWGYFFHLPQEGEPIRVRYGDSQEGELEQRFSWKKVHVLPRECIE
jgi:hypothetical protein